MKDKVKFYLRKTPLKKVLREPIRLWKRIINNSDYRKNAEEMMLNLSKSNKDEIKIWYFCAPTHNNLGDLAQRYCIENWMMETYPDRKYIVLPSRGIHYYGKKFLKIMKNHLNEEDIFIFQSGYTMADFHPDDYVRKLILNEFCLNKCLILPQTFLYRYEKKLKQIKNCIENVEDLTLLARDEISYNNMKENLSVKKIELYPDIVTTLIGKNTYNSDRNGICVCVRNDGEKFYSDYEINELINKLKTINSVVDITDTNCDSIKQIDLNNIEKFLFEKIKAFSKYNVIVTDRYHGTIFSLIAGTPVIVIKTNDHKVVTGLNWFKGKYDDYIYYCDELNEVPDTVNKILEKNTITHELEPYFKKEYYDKLKNIL